MPTVELLCIELIDLYTVTSTDTYAVMNYIFYMRNSKDFAVFTVQAVLFLTFFFFPNCVLVNLTYRLEVQACTAFSKTLGEVRAVCFPKRSKPNLILWPYMKFLKIGMFTPRGDESNCISSDFLN